MSDGVGENIWEDITVKCGVTGQKKAGYIQESFY